MRMLPEKKATIETFMAMGLLAIFGLTLARGPLMKMLKPAPPLLPASPPPSSEAGAGNAVQLASAPTVVSSQPASSGTLSAAKAYTAYEFRDPFESRLPAPSKVPADSVRDASPSSPPSTPQEQLSESPALPPLRIEGMLWGGAQPKAIINGNVYGVNDIVNGLTIVAIDHRGVAVNLGGKPVYIMPSTGSTSGNEQFSQYQYGH